VRGIYRHNDPPNFNPIAAAVSMSRSPSLVLAELITGFQDKLVAEINDTRIVANERDGLRIAGALFRDELRRLGIPNVDPNTQANEKTALTNPHVMGVCRPGHGAETCRYLTILSTGWACMKKGFLAAKIDERVDSGRTLARGDNCEGRRS
jgi:hypothetical protein